MRPTLVLLAVLAWLAPSAATAQPRMPAPQPPPAAPGAAPGSATPGSAAPGSATPGRAAAAEASETYTVEEIARAADGAFGEAAEGVARAIERVFVDLGRPNAYIVGREGAGAFGLGLRYGSGTLFSRVEGERTVYWTGPSIGFDAGGDANRVFTLVYNLHDSDELFQRFPAVEGRAYLVGGVSVNYHQRGRVVLVPVRLGAGWRLGANVGYLRYTREQRILPF